MGPFFLHKLQEEFIKENVLFLEDFFFIFIYLCSNLKSFPSPELFIKTKRQDEDKSEHPGKW